MEERYRAQTFGSAIAMRRKERSLSQMEFLERTPELRALLSVRELNELEQDRLDPRRVSRSEIIIPVLCQALNLDEAYIRDLAADHERAAAIEQDFQAQMQLEAVAFRARTQLG